MPLMTTRERFQAVMNFQPFDRLPVVELAVWWDKTIARWHGEGLPKAWSPGANRYEICRHFGLENYTMCHFFPNRGPDCPPPAGHGQGLVASVDDYERVKPHLFPWPVVDHEYWGQWAEQQRAGDAVASFALFGYFWFPRELFGIEQHFFAFYDHPELMHRMNQDVVEYHLRIIEEVCRTCTPDFIMISEDMSYNHGPMLSEDLFNEFMAPYYRRLLGPLKERGILVFIDSDGDVTEAWQWFEEAGLDGIWPLERQAGVDVALLRERYPRARFMGTFDKMTMSRGEAAMRAEFERLLPVAARGGLIVCCDHQTPPEVSYQDYQLYLRLFREYAKEAGRLSRERAAGE